MSSLPAPETMPDQRPDAGSLREVLLHVHLHSHPGMNAAFKEMRALGKSDYVATAALQYSRSRHGNVGKAAGAFRDGRLAVVKRSNESSAELLHLGKGV